MTDQEITRELTIWTIYQAPADYPSVPFVVRGWLIAGGGITVDSGAVGFADTLDQARGIVPAGLTCVGRQPDDEPHIVESWV